MFGVIGKLELNYTVNGAAFNETIPITTMDRIALSGCPECIMNIDEVVFVIDTIYGVTIYFNDNEDDAILVSGNETCDFTVEKHSIVGTIKLCNT